MTTALAVATLERLRFEPHDYNFTQLAVIHNLSATLSVFKDTQNTKNTCFF